MKHVRKKRETQRVYVHYTVYQIFLNRCIHMAHAFMNKKCKILISSTVLRTYRQWSYKNFSRESLLSKIPDSRESNFLRITDASVRDAGKYMCIASNGYPPPVSHTFQLWVKRKSIETAVARFFSLYCFRTEEAILMDSSKSSCASAINQCCPEAEAPRS